jgi:tetratricopeptide (TPR) repeat protein
MSVGEGTASTVRIARDSSGRLGTPMRTVLLAALLFAAPRSEDLSRPRALLDAGRAAEAYRALAATRSADGLLLRSTAAFLLGEDAGGRRDLERALELDPTLRQGWLNRAALALADDRPEDAYRDLVRARDLDPGAADNDLNLGAVELLRGNLDAATRHFSAHLGRDRSTDAYLLVASNYARAGYAALAAENLRRAIALDERARARALADPNFEMVATSPAFGELWTTDSWMPPAGAHRAQQAYAIHYTPDGALLRATLDALLALGEPNEPRVEANPSFALIWTPTYRIKLVADRVELTSVRPVAEADWAAQSSRLFRAVAASLLTR